MVYDIILIYKQTVCFFTADLVSWFRSKLQSVAVMASSRKCLLEDEIEQSLFEELTASDQSSSSDDDDSSGTDDLTVGKVIGSEYSDDESDNEQCTTVSSASSATFTWEDMTNYVGQRENFFLITVGLRMKSKMKLTVLKCSKCFLMTNRWN